MSVISVFAFKLDGLESEIMEYIWICGRMTDINRITKFGSGERRMSLYVC